MDKARPQTLPIEPMITQSILKHLLPNYTDRQGKISGFVTCAGTFGYKWATYPTYQFQACWFQISRLPSWQMTPSTYILRFKKGTIKFCVAEPEMAKWKYWLYCIIFAMACNHQTILFHKVDAISHLVNLVSFRSDNF